MPARPQICASGKKSEKKNHRRLAQGGTSKGMANGSGLGVGGFVVLLLLYIAQAHAFALVSFIPAR
jgi:hypothetical protein